MSWFSGGLPTWGDMTQGSSSSRAQRQQDGPEQLNYQPRQQPIRHLQVHWGQQRLSVDLPRKPHPTTVGDLKAAISALTAVPPERQQLVAGGVHMKDDRASLARYRLRDQGRVTLVAKGVAPPGQSKQARAPGSEHPPRTGSAGGNDVGSESNRPTPEFQAQQAAAAARKAAESDQSEAGVRRRIAEARESAEKELQPEVEQLERSVAAIETNGLDKTISLEEVPKSAINPTGNNATTTGLLNGHQIVFAHKKLGELLLKLLLSLDNVLVQTDELRSTRKAVVKQVQSLLDRVDAAWTKAKSLGVTPNM